MKRHSNEKTNKKTYQNKQNRDRENWKINRRENKNIKKYPHQSRATKTAQVSIEIVPNGNNKKCWILSDILFGKLFVAMFTYSILFFAPNPKFYHHHTSHFQPLINFYILVIPLNHLESVCSLLMNVYDGRLCYYFYRSKNKFSFILNEKKSTR